MRQVADFAAPGPFHVRSQDEDHPFYAAAYMTGGQPFGGAGDPEWVNVVPTAQYQDRYVFFTDTDRVQRLYHRYLRTGPAAAMRSASSAW